MWEPTSGAYFYGVNRKILRKSCNLEIMFYGFPREKKQIWTNLRKYGLVRLGWYCSTNNIVLLVSINNFELNPILVNVDKLEPYTYVD
jgi:hypothetical protein